MVLGAKPPRRQRQQQLACGEALQELPLDPPERYQAELTGVPGLGRPVVPGNSGLEISAGQKGRPDPRGVSPPQLMHLCNWNCFTEILQIRANCFQVSHKNYKIALHGKSNECQLSGTVIKVEI